MYLPLFLAIVSSISAGLHGGTTGIGPVFSFPLSPETSLRTGIGLLGFSRTENVDDISYDLDFSLRWVPVILDWNPGASAFRMSGGFFFNGTKAETGYIPESSIEFGGHTYTPQNIGEVTGQVTMQPVSPYLGIGLGNPGGTGMHFLIDGGVSFTGFTADLSHEGGNLSPALEEQLAEDLEMEADSLEDALDDLSVYPVVSVSLIYGW